jgi:hypothetical protein
MFGGKIKRANPVKLKHDYFDWSDVILCGYHIEYTGELTPDVCKAIEKAWDSDPRNAPESSRGQLRWSAGAHAVRVDVENRQLIVSKTIMLCD